MHGKVVLISDDDNFFEYIIPKLLLRNSDEVIQYDFEDLINNINSLSDSLLIVNSENNEEQTLDLLKITNNNPVLVFGYNNDDEFKIKAYNSGMFGYFTLSTKQEELNALMLPAFRLLSNKNKYETYRDILIKNNLLSSNNDVFYDYHSILDKQIELINSTSSKAVLMAISPDEKLKFLISPNQIETIIKNNIRENDILMNFAPSKYLLLIKNTDLNGAKNLWDKINTNFPEGMYVGFSNVNGTNSQKVINDVTYKLQMAINSGNSSSNVIESLQQTNFKQLKSEFSKKLEQIVYPVFFQIQQAYCDKLFGISIEQKFENNNWMLYLKSEGDKSGTLKISNPGYFAINIDIKYDGFNFDEQKHISLEQNELEEGLLSDILEQFIIEFKNLFNGGNNNDNS